jgi:hypothetical protein
MYQAALSYPWIVSFSGKPVKLADSNTPPSALTSRNDPAIMVCVRSPARPSPWDEFAGRCAARDPYTWVTSSSTRSACQVPAPTHLFVREELGTRP